MSHLYSLLLSSSSASRMYHVQVPVSLRADEWADGAVFRRGCCAHHFATRRHESRRALSSLFHPFLLPMCILLYICIYLYKTCVMVPISMYLFTCIYTRISALNTLHVKKRITACSFYPNSLAYLRWYYYNYYSYYHYYAVIIDYKLPLSSSLEWVTYVSSYAYRLPSHSADRFVWIRGRPRT